MLKVEGSSRRKSVMRQRTLFQNRKGMPGGMALVEKRGLDYMRSIASNGGKATFSRYGREHMQKLARAAAAARIRKVDSTPYTFRSWDGSLLRSVPYEKPKSRAKRPIKVLIEQQEQQETF